MRRAEALVLGRLRRRHADVPVQTALLGKEGRIDSAQFQGVRPSLHTEPSRPVKLAARIYKERLENNVYEDSTLGLPGQHLVPSVPASQAARGLRSDRLKIVVPQPF